MITLREPKETVIDHTKCELDAVEFCHRNLDGFGTKEISAVALLLKRIAYLEGCLAEQYEIAREAQKTALTLSHRTIREAGLDRDLIPIGEIAKGVVLDAEKKMRERA